MTALTPQAAALARLFNGLEQLRTIKARQRKPKPSGVDVTVAVMSYNNASFVSQTIESVLAQEGVNLELKVFDDCSPDDSVQILERFCQDPRFAYQVNEHNLGMIGNYNQCLRSGSGRYVVVLGSDDVIYPGHLRSLVEAMDQHPQVALGYTQCLWIDSQGQLLKHAVHPGHLGSSYVGGRDELVDLLTHDSYITPSAAIFRRSALARFTLEDGGIHREEMLAGDWELWTRIAQAAPDFLFLRQATVGYRIHGGQISQKFYASDKPLAEHTRILELNLAVPEARRRMQRGADGIWQLYLRRLAGYPGEVQARFEQRKEAIRQALFEIQHTLAESSTHFSVILTTFNRPRLLADALDSLAAQTWTDFEVILVNDKGAPVEALLDNYSFPITYLRQGRNQGPAAARNAAHLLARGHYVVYLDDDDLYLPHHLQTLAEATERHSGEVVYTDAVLVTETLEGDARVEIRREQRYSHGEFSKERLFYNNYIPVNTFACPRALIAAVGGFDEQLPAFEDWDFLMRLAQRANFRHVHSETVEARMRASQVDPTRRSQQAFKDYPALYQQLYTRHGDLGSELVRSGRQKMLVRLGVIEQAQPEAPDVQDWFSERTLSPTQLTLVEQRLKAYPLRARFGILVLDLEGEPSKVSATQRSLVASQQTYGHLQPLLLSVATDAHPDFEGQVLTVTADNWIAQVNQLLTQPDFDWFCLLDAGDELTANGLLVAGLELLDAPGCRALYCDGLYRQNDGLGAVLRPDFNLDYLLSLPTSMGRHWLLRRDAVLDAGGFDPHFRQRPEFELILRLITTGGLGGLGHIAEPLLISDSPQLTDLDDERTAIVQHLQARGYESPQVHCDTPGQYRIHYGHREQPLVSILVTAGNELNYLQRCVESLLQNTRYRNHELLLIETAPDAAEVHAWLNAIAQLDEPGVRALVQDGAHASQAAALNHGAEQAHGDYLLLLSPRTAFFDQDWLDEMLNHAQRPEVGAVGAKLVSADSRISHAGLILGLQGPVGRPFAGMPADAPGYMQRIQVDQNFSAVSGDCLLVARQAYLTLGGFAEDVPPRYQDVDLCLRLKQAGYLNVWAANAHLMISEKPAEYPPAEEEDALYAKWLPVLARDTAYNPNLSLIQKGGFKLASAALSWHPLSSWKPMPTVLAHPADLGANGHYRVLQPFTAMQQSSLADGALSLGLLHVPDLERYAPDSIILQGQLSEERLEAMYRMKNLSAAFKVLELDLPALPMDARARLDVSGATFDALRRGLSFVDRLLVPTASLAEVFCGLHGDIQVIESRLPPQAWATLHSQRRVGAKPRIGLTGGAQESHDLVLLAEVIEALAGKVEWVLLGACPDVLRPFINELHGEVPAERYPATLALLNLDLVLAPRAQNACNEHLDAVRLLEYGACGYPVICSEVGGYRHAGLPVTRVANRTEDWLQAIGMHLADLGASARLGDELQAIVRRDWMLDQRHLQAWRNAWLAG
jgi:glycosyltransferase involved in cell wall biosynthesis